MDSTELRLAAIRLAFEARCASIDFEARTHNTLLMMALGAGFAATFAWSLRLLETLPFAVLGVGAALVVAAKLHALSRLMAQAEAAAREADAAIEAILREEGGREEEGA